MRNKIELGQKLWWVPANPNHGRQSEVIVTKLGRRWANLDNYQRIDVNTMEADRGNYTSPGMCFLSKEAYEEILELEKAWKKLITDMRRANIPSNVNISNIKDARTLLGLG